MINHNYDKMVRSYRKKPIFDLEKLDNNNCCVTFGLDDIKKIIPHREPFLLIDEINLVDKNKSLIVGSRKINEDDPVLKGHFPSYPIYPAVLQIEMVSQLMLCFERITNSIYDTKENVRMTKVLYSIFQREVLPSKKFYILAKILEKNELNIIGIGQIMVDKSVYSLIVSEFMVL